MNRNRTHRRRAPGALAALASAQPVWRYGASGAAPSTDLRSEPSTRRARPVTERLCRGPAEASLRAFDPLTDSKWDFSRRQVVMTERGEAPTGPRRPFEYAVVTKGRPFTRSSTAPRCASTSRSPATTATSS